MVRIFTVPERIKLFKNINKIHKEIYGWKMIYDNAQRGGSIDIEGDTRAVPINWVPMGINEIKDYYFYDTNGRDITLLCSLFAWQAYYFNHVNPYDFSKYDTRQEDLISDSLGKRVRPDVDHPILCSESLLEVQQRKDDGKIWISSNWQYRPECYGPADLLDEAILASITKQAGGDKNLSDKIKERYWKNKELDKERFMMLLDRYFKGDRLRGRHWEGGYAFAASRTWIIKNSEQLNEALEVEDRHFQKAMEQYFRWFRGKVVKLSKEDELALKKEFSHSYSGFPRSQAINLCKQLMEEDKANPSDVYLWWGGEPNRDANYALLTLFFEVDPEDIGTSRFDEKVSRNLRTIINISENDGIMMNSSREYEPSVWRAIFS